MCFTPPLTKPLPAPILRPPPAPPSRTRSLRSRPLLAARFAARRYSISSRTVRRGFAASRVCAYLRPREAGRQGGHGAARQGRGPREARAAGTAPKGVRPARPAGASPRGFRHTSARCRRARTYTPVRAVGHAPALLLLLLLGLASRRLFGVHDQPAAAARARRRPWRAAAGGGVRHLRSSEMPPGQHTAGSLRVKRMLRVNELGPGPGRTRAQAQWRQRAVARRAQKPVAIGPPCAQWV
jgi:hypothetical protein